MMENTTYIVFIRDIMDSFPKCRTRYMAVAVTDSLKKVKKYMKNHGEIINRGNRKLTQSVDYTMMSLTSHAAIENRLPHEKWEVLEYNNERMSEPYSAN